MKHLKCVGVFLGICAGFALVIALLVGFLLALEYFFGYLWPLTLVLTLGLYVILSITHDICKDW